MKNIGLIAIAISIIFAASVAAFMFRYQPLSKVPQFGGAYVLDRWSGTVK